MALLGQLVHVFWNGSPARRMLGFAAIVLVLLASNTAGLDSLAQLAGFGLLLACFLVIYGLILRGR